VIQNTQNILDVNSILWKGVVGGGGGGVWGRLWRCGRAEACSLSSSLMVLRFAGGGVGPSSLVAGSLPRGTEMRV